MEMNKTALSKAAWLAGFSYLLWAVTGLSGCSSFLRSCIARVRYQLGRTRPP